MIVEEFLEQVESGRRGDNWGLEMGMPKLEHYVDGVSQSTYTLLFGPSGSGKTTFALYSYIYRPFMDNMDNDNFRVIYYSLEMPRTILFGKLVGMYILEKYGIELSIKELLSKRRNEALSDEHYQILLDSLDWMHKLESRFTVYDKLLTAPLLKKHLHEQLKKYGTFSEVDNKVIYTKKNPKQVLLVAIDHFGLMRTSEGRTLKQEIDLASSTFVNYRNGCGISPLALLQMNRDASSMDRRNAGFQEPQRSDVKDTGNVEQDCDVMLAIFDPMRENMKTYRKYDVTQLARIIRGIILLKNRYGDGDVRIVSAFYGKCGIWKELPKAELITDYSKYQTVDWKKEVDKVEPKRSIMFTS